MGKTERIKCPHCKRTWWGLLWDVVNTKCPRCGQVVQGFFISKACLFTVELGTQYVLPPRRVVFMPCFDTEELLRAKREAAR